MSATVNRPVKPNATVVVRDGWAVSIRVGDVLLPTDLVTGYTIRSHTGDWDRITVEFAGPTEIIHDPHAGEPG